MKNINPIFIDELNKKFANRFTIESEENYTAICFPEKSHEHKPIKICEQYPGAYIVFVGKFTHAHFDCYEGSEETQIKKAIEKITYFLENVFMDNVICFGSHDGGGGCYVIEDESEERKISFRDDIKYFVWSGIYKKKNIL